MLPKKRWLVLFFTLALTFCPVVVASAQDGVLTPGQPTIGAITAAGQTLRYLYSPAQASSVSFQALSSSAPPTLLIVSTNEIVAAQPNSEGALTISLSAFLNAGDYEVIVGSATGATGEIIILVQSETPISIVPLPVGQAVNSEVSSGAPIALYSFSALGEQAFLLFESGLPASSAGVRLLNTTSGGVSGTMSSDMIGARFRIPAGSALYQVEVQHSGGSSAEPFSLCLTAVGAGGCEAGSAPAPAATAEVEPTVTLQTGASGGACSVTPASSAVNIRQSASTNTPIISALPGGAFADVIGVSPDGTFFNVQYAGASGWVSRSVVTTSGDCGGVPIVNPPPVSQPAQPTQSPPTGAPQQPTQPPPSPTEAPSGPCLITMTGERLVYTQPNAIPDYIYDEVQPGYELVPVGRLADNSWWQTNYAGAWIQPGGAAQVSGDCSGLPVISP